MDIIQFINKVKEIGALPDGRFSPADILGLANGEMNATVQKLLACREDYLVESMDLTLADLQGLGYRIPAYFVGSKIRKMDVISSQNEHQSVPRVTVDDLDEGIPGYAIIGNRIQGAGIDRYGQNFKLYYYGRPNELDTFDPSQDTTPTLFNPVVQSTNGNIVQFENGGPEDAFTTKYQLQPGANTVPVDFYKSDGSHEYLIRNVTVSYDATTALATLPTDAASLGIEAGDFLCYTGVSDHVSLPEEFANVHIQRTVCKCLEALGDQAGLQVAQSKLTELEKLATDMMSQRDDGRAKTISIGHTNPFRYSKRFWR